MSLPRILYLRYPYYGVVQRFFRSLNELHPFLVQIGPCFCYSTVLFLTKHVLRLGFRFVPQRCRFSRLDENAIGNSQRGDGGTTNMACKRAFDARRWSRLPAALSGGYVMAEKRSRNKLQQSSLVNQLRPDPSVPANVQLLTGWLGRSTKPDHWRLYISPDLNSYIDLAEKDIVHHYDFGDSNPLGAVLLWVKRDAPLSLTTEAQSRFLEGGIADLYLPAAGAGGIGAGNANLQPLCSWTVGNVQTQWTTAGVSLFICPATKC